MDLSLPQNQYSVSSANLNSKLLPSPEFSSDNHTSNTSLDDLLASHSHATDVGMEWLSTFVEDCLSSSGSCLLELPKIVQTNSSSSSSSPVPQQIQSDHNLDRVKKNTSFMFQRIGIPWKKARSKRKRKRRPMISSSFLKRTRTQHFNDPTLLHQAYWLADSELIINPPDENIVKTSNKLSSSPEEEVVDDGEGQQEKEQRRCSHCLAQRTPQWRAGPLGPKTLCNACGVRYKSGRLLPEYRPAKSPTFVSFKHSNSHKKVMEMRMSQLFSNPILDQSIN